MRKGERKIKVAQGNPRLFVANSAAIAHFEPLPPFEISSGLNDSMSKSPHYVGFLVRTQTTINIRPDVQLREGCG